MNWLYYLAEANIYLGVFYLAYCLFLNRETYYQLNRAYLIISCIAAFILPVLQICSLKHVKPATVASVTYAVPVQTISAVPVQTIPAATVQVTPAVTATAIATPIIEHHFTLQDYLWYGYIAGVVILVLVLLIKLYTLFRLMRNEQCIKQDKHKLIYLTDTDVAFSFLNYLFIGTNAPGANTMIRHELVHIRQRHSADIIFIELLKIISWFNPCIYLLQNSLKTVHEYIADEQTAAFETDALTYSSFLVNNAYGAGGSSITHSFFNYNLLKKRIIMLNQQRSGNLARLKYLVAVPICAALLCASTLAFSKTYGWVDLAPVNAEQITWASKGGKLPLPAVVVDGFPMLDRYLHKNIHYSSDKGEKGGLVVVGFSLDKDRKITGLKIVKSAGSKLDALALNGFRSYKGIVNDNSDKNYKLGVYFFTNDYSIFIDPYIKDPEFVGELIITNYNYVPSVTNKGYEYDEDIHGYGKKIIFATVTIYEKNKEAKVYQLNTATPDEIKLLKEKYGYIFPTASAGEDTQITVFRDEKRYEYVDVYLRVSSYLEAPYADDFYNYIFGHVKYPQKEKNDLVGGLVVLNFSIKNNGTIDNVSVSQSAGHNFDEAAINALQAYKGSIKDKAGQHSIAIVFCVVEKEIRPIVSEKIKKIGYVGEIAISELGRNTIQIDNK